MAQRSRFADSEYLRHVLMRLHIKGADAWRTDPEADELIRYAIDRFAQLARKHGLEPDDAGSAAFEAMRNPSVFFGDDPWGVIVHAVTTTIEAWEFADEALCSIETARRGGLSGVTPERFSDRETPVWEYDHNFTVTDDQHREPWTGPSIAGQAEEIALLFAEHGWPLEATATAVEVILRRLAASGSRPAAYEALRKDKKWRAITDLPATSWTGLLRLLLGNPADPSGITSKGRGILLRLALGEDIDDLAHDKQLVGGIRLVTPGKQWRRT
jgi:hypothetical protein